MPKSLEELASPFLKGLVPYLPGKPVEEVERELGIKGAVKLASNENPLGPSPQAVRALREALPDSHRYPDGWGYYLKRALADRLGVTSDHLILGNGCNEILRWSLLIRPLSSMECWLTYRGVRRSSCR
ncbi:MAG: hisC [candidate division NC10 bacterium]|nr:hisC [candidate division NC10 bacterium]